MSSFGGIRTGLVKRKPQWRDRGKTRSTISGKRFQSAIPAAVLDGRPEIN